MPISRIYCGFKIMEGYLARLDPDKIVLQFFLFNEHFWVVINKIKFNTRNVIFISISIYCSLISIRILTS